MLSIQSISKSYKKQQVLQNVSFDAAPGECIGLLGPNGCGKSTLLHILSGTDTPDSGTILFDGKNLLKNPSLQSTKIGYVAQNNPIFPDMTAMDHLKLWYSATKYSIEDDLKDITGDLDVSYSSNRYIEFNHQGVNKGQGLKKLTDILGVDIKETIAIGDNFNDLSMIKVAGLGVGVQNTVEDMKKECDVITKATNNENAVAEVISKYILGTN